MMVTTIPTMTFYNTYVKPLRELGFMYVHEAFNAGVITLQEAQFIVAMLRDDYLPMEVIFRASLDARFNEIPR